MLIVINAIVVVATERDMASWVDLFGRIAWDSIALVGVLLSVLGMLINHFARRLKEELDAQEEARKKALEEARAHGRAAAPPLSPERKYLGKLIAAIVVLITILILWFMFRDAISGFDFFEDILSSAVMLMAFVLVVTFVGLMATWLVFSIIHLATVLVTRKWRQIKKAEGNRLLGLFEYTVNIPIRIVKRLLKSFVRLFTGPRTEGARNSMLYVAAGIASIVSFFNAYLGIRYFFIDEIPRSNITDSEFVIRHIIAVALSLAIQLAVLVFGLMHGSVFTEAFHLIRLDLQEIKSKGGNIGKKVACCFGRAVKPLAYFVPYLLFMVFSVFFAFYAMFSTYADTAQIHRALFYEARLETERALDIQGIVTKMDTRYSNNVTTLVVGLEAEAERLVRLRNEAIYQLRYEWDNLTRDVEAGSATATERNEARDRYVNFYNNTRNLIAVTDAIKTILDIPFELFGQPTLIVERYDYYFMAISTPTYSSMAFSFMLQNMPFDVGARYQPTPHLTIPGRIVRPARADYSILMTQENIPHANKYYILTRLYNYFVDMQNEITTRHRNIMASATMPANLIEILTWLEAPPPYHSPEEILAMRDRVIAIYNANASPAQIHYRTLADLHARAIAYDPNHAESEALIAARHLHLAAQYYLNSFIRRTQNLAELINAMRLVSLLDDAALGLVNIVTESYSHYYNNNIIPTVQTRAIILQQPGGTPFITIGIRYNQLPLHPFFSNRHVGPSGNYSISVTERISPELDRHNVMVWLYQYFIDLYHDVQRTYALHTRGEVGQYTSENFSVTFRNLLNENEIIDGVRENIVSLPNVVSTAENNTNPPTPSPIISVRTLSRVVLDMLRFRRNHNSDKHVQLAQLAEFAETSIEIYTMLGRFIALEDAANGNTNSYNENAVATVRNFMVYANSVTNSDFHLSLDVLTRGRFGTNITLNNQQEPRSYLDSLYTFGAIATLFLIFALAKDFISFVVGAAIRKEIYSLKIKDVSVVRHIGFIGMEGNLASIFKSPKSDANKKLHAKYLNDTLHGTTGTMANAKANANAKCIAAKAKQIALHGNWLDSEQKEKLLLVAANAAKIKAEAADNTASMAKDDTAKAAEQLATAIKALDGADIATADIGALENVLATAKTEHESASLIEIQTKTESETVRSKYELLQLEADTTTADTKALKNALDIAKTNYRNAIAAHEEANAFADIEDLELKDYREKKDLQLKALGFEMNNEASDDKAQLLSWLDIHVKKSKALSKLLDNDK